MARTAADVARMVSRHRTYLLTVKRLGPSAVQRYEAAIRRWWGWCRAQRQDPLAATEDAAAAYALALVDARSHKPYSPSTVAHFLSCCRGFYDWAIDHEIAERNPFARVRGPKDPKRLPRVLSQQEVRAILDAVAGSHPRDVRDRAILAVLYATACRVSEVCGLRLQDVDLEAGRAVVLGKGAKEGVVFLGGAVADLRRYLEGARLSYSRRGEAPWVFLGLHGERLRRQGVQDAIDRAVERAGLQKRVTPHWFRHSAATHLRQNGLDTRVIQEVLRHERLQTTQVYTHVAPEEVAAAHAQFHPLARTSVPVATSRPPRPKPARSAMLARRRMRSR